MRPKLRHFAVLGVTPADDMTTIRMAWRSKVRLLHPDRARNRAKATADLAEVNAAFDALQGHVPVPTFENPVGRVAPKAKGLRKKPEQPVAGGASAETPPPKARSVGLNRELQKLSERARDGYARARQIVRST
ncbi:MAG: J domain-containing protein [Pseudomonadota bacterium]